ncbi:hypothetical protein [Thermococcus sp.]|uniref:hypothetical protein n=1 Tax=Thermococcus sp. TaxID=35749 RepID=UPI0026178182|nr:hypothetical protein [Thermococcus sp.]
MNKKKLAGAIFGVVVLVIAAMATPAIATNSGVITLDTILHGSFSTAEVYIAAQYAVQNRQFQLGPSTRVHFGSSSGTGSNAYWYTTDSYTAPATIQAHGTWHLNAYTHYGLTEASYDGSSELQIYLEPSGRTPTAKNISPQEKLPIKSAGSTQLELRIIAYVDSHGGVSISRYLTENVGVSIEIPVSIE